MKLNTLDIKNRKRKIKNFPAQTMFLSFFTFIYRHLHFIHYICTYKLYVHVIWFVKLHDNGFYTMVLWKTTCLGKSILQNEPVRFQVGWVWSCNIKLIHMTHWCYLKEVTYLLNNLINTPTLLTTRPQTSTASEHLYMTHMHRCTFTSTNSKHRHHTAWWFDTCCKSSCS